MQVNLLSRGLFRARNNSRAKKGYSWWATRGSAGQRFRSRLVVKAVSYRGIMQIFVRRKSSRIIIRIWIESPEVWELSHPRTTSRVNICKTEITISQWKAGEGADVKSTLRILIKPGESTRSQGEMKLEAISRPRRHHLRCCDNTWSPSQGTAHCVHCSRIVLTTAVSH